MTIVKTLLSALFYCQLSFAQITTSHYVAVNDSIKLAVDVHLPNDYKEGKLPVLVIYTRYWRSTISRKTGEPVPPFNGLDRYLSKNGYVIVKVDARGSGASFGTRLAEYSPREVMDANAILDWVCDQSWSNSKIGSYGTSYEGTTAELLCATNHPSIKVVIPGWSDFDLYRSPVRPYGMLASAFIKKWSRYVAFLDNNRSLFLGESVRPVDKDSLKMALKEHKKNLKVYKMTKNGPYRNSNIGRYTYEDCSVVRWKDEIEKSGVPMLVLTSWMDAGTAEGTLQRLQHFSNPQKVVMMATSHGGGTNASTFVVGDTLYYPNPNYDEQRKIQLQFLDHYLKDADTIVDQWPLIRYMNMGEEKFRESDIWPPDGVTESNFYFGENGTLSGAIPMNSEASDQYKIDFSTTTGTTNRWSTQMEGPVMHLNNRNEEDHKMLTYTTPPMTENLQITGTPIITLQLSSTHEDGAVFVYLEDIDENGVSRYITEGGLRLIHRKMSTDSSSYNIHSFNEEDAAPMVPGSIIEVTFKLWPTSVMIQKGHSLRIAISGADKDTFDRIPKRGKPTLTVHRSATKMSYVNLPVIK